MAAPGHLRRQVAEEGWCVLPGVLSPAESRAVLGSLWAAAEESERRGMSTHMPVLDPNPANVRVFNLLDIDPVFRDLIRRPIALDFVSAVLGPEFLVSNFTANIARPGARSMALHSDQSFVAPEPWHAPWSINIIWCLTDVHRDNGATLFIPGSHHWRTRTDVPADAISRLQPFEAEAGSIIVMEGRIWHTSGANVTADEDRAMMFAYYSAPFLRPQMNWNATLSAETQALCDEQLRRLLGLDAFANQGVGVDLRYLETQFGAPAS